MRHKNSRPATRQGGNITEYFVFSTVYLTGGTSVYVDDTDLCALLGNALDNAMEAAAKAGDKKIFMRCRADKGMLMLKVRNALAGDEREVPGLFLSYGFRF